MELKERMLAKIVFRIEATENDFGGTSWKTTILGSKGMISQKFKDKIYEDLGIEVDELDMETIQEVIE